MIYIPFALINNPSPINSEGATNLLNREIHIEDLTEFTYIIQPILSSVDYSISKDYYTRSRTQVTSSTRQL